MAPASKRCSSTSARSPSKTCVGGSASDDPLQPFRQDRDRVIDAAERQQDEGHRPGEPLRAEPFPEHHAGGDEPDRPARQDEVQEEGRNGEPERPEIEAEEEHREDCDRHQPDQHAHDAHHHQRRDQLRGPERRHHQVAEVARPHLFQERDGEADLPAEKDVPEEHRADEGAARLRRHGCAIHQVELQEPPHHHLHRRPVDQVDDARPGIAEQVPVAQHHRADAAKRYGVIGGVAHSVTSRPFSSRRRSRATSRNTSSIVSRP